MRYNMFGRSGVHDTGEVVGQWPGIAGFTLEYRAEAFCPECTRDIVGHTDFERAEIEDIETDGHGAVQAVLSDSEVDCPGFTCGHCGITLDVRVLHYGEVCNHEF